MRHDCRDHSMGATTRACMLLPTAEQLKLNNMTCHMPHVHVHAHVHVHVVHVILCACACACDAHACACIPQVWNTTPETAINRNPRRANGKLQEGGLHSSHLGRSAPSQRMCLILIASSRTYWPSRHCNCPILDSIRLYPSTVQVQLPRCKCHHIAHAQLRAPPHPFNTRFAYRPSLVPLASSSSCVPCSTMRP